MAFLGLTKDSPEEVTPTLENVVLGLYSPHHNAHVTPAWLHVIMYITESYVRVANYNILGRHIATFIVVPGNPTMGGADYFHSKKSIKGDAGSNNFYKYISNTMKGSIDRKAKAAWKVAKQTGLFGGPPNHAELDDFLGYQLRMETPKVISLQHFGPETFAYALGEAGHSTLAEYISEVPSEPQGSD